MSDVVKLSFIGDIMCEKPMQLYAEKHGFSSFEKIFSNTEKRFNESDFVIGNLETVFGGYESGYTRELYNFNTPDAFAEALSRSGIQMVTTATNHSLDRGLEGLIRTISILDKYGIEHTGTYAKECDERVFIKKIGKTKVSILNYTYGTNVHETHVILNPEQEYHLNLIKPQTYNLQTYVNAKEAGVIKLKISKLLGKIIGCEQKIKLKRLLHIPYNSIRIDHLDMEELDDTYLERIKKDINKAGTESDFVIVCIHSGGQFNSEPGEFTKYIVQKLIDFGVNAVIANHPHVVQKFDIQQGVFVSYSLGNYSISPSSIYLLPDYKPEYSIVLHLYINEEGVKRVSFSILRIEENKDEGLSVYFVDDLYKILSDKRKKELKEDIKFIYHRFTGTQLEGSPLEKEYTIFEANNALIN